ncbi:hypothetical protein GJAV_G00187490 [Gymnothorax javanicus]|nr:hypothetical protein GJAV_G00187490 [Gymnothorax javanicus]
MAGVSTGETVEKWPEIEKAASEKRRELVLQGPNIDKKILKGGLNPAVYSLTLLNYLEISQCPSLIEIQNDIENLTHLQSLILCRNKLSTIPKATGNLKYLKVLDVSVNDLEALPDELSQLGELTTLNISCNKIKSLPGGLNRCTKLSTLNVSKNNITRFPDDLYSVHLDLLSTIVASENSIEELSGDISNLPALKILDLSNNKLSDIPFDLADCAKLKEINFKGNKLKDKRLEKMVNGCQTKSILDYLRAGGKVKEVRPYIVCCVVKGLNLRPGNALKRFLLAQIKLHDEMCGKRTLATIATHDLQLLHWPLVYDARPPKMLKIVPLSRKETNAVDLMRQLQFEAEEQRKQKKRQNVSGLHKYLQLLDGKENYPCVIDAQDHVISFPPITNSEKTKMRKTTAELFVEVTSSTSLQICKDVMDALIVKMAELNKFTLEHREEPTSDGESDLAGNTTPEMSSSELVVQQVRVVDMDGNLKVVYPSKTDLTSDTANLTVIR